MTTAPALTDPALLETDEQREARIKAAIDAWSAARSRGDVVAAREHWSEAVTLIEGRSPEQVAKMEKEKGLT